MSLSIIKPAYGNINLKEVTFLDRGTTHSPSVSHGDIFQRKAPSRCGQLVCHWLLEERTQLELSGGGNKKELKLLSFPKDYNVLLSL